VTEYCPNCRTARVGQLRYCRNCAFDYDTLPAPTTDPGPPAASGPSESAPATVPGVGAPVAETRASRRTWIILGLVIFVAIVAAAGFVGLNNSGALTAHHDVIGTFELRATDTAFPAILVTSGGCKGTGGYADIAEGTSVTLKDGSGSLLATSVLGPGSGTSTNCLVSFNLPAVPEVPFYSLEVGRRGALSYDLASMKSRGWAIGGTLGS
jgi:hypothetical protein